MGGGALYRPERQPRGAFDRCRRTRVAFIRYFFPARRLLRPLRSMAVPTAGRTCPAQAGAAAGGKAERAVFFAASVTAAQGAMDRACRLGAGTALAARAYMGGGLRQPDHRTAGAGGCGAAQLRLAARHCRNRGAAAHRRVCTAGKRRVLVGKPEF